MGRIVGWMVRAALATASAVALAGCASATRDVEAASPAITAGPDQTLSGSGRVIREGLEITTPAGAVRVVDRSDGAEPAVGSVSAHGVATLTTTLREAPSTPMELAVTTRFPELDGVTPTTWFPAALSTRRDGTTGVRIGRRNHTATVTIGVPTAADADGAPVAVVVARRDSIISLRVTAPPTAAFPVRVTVIVATRPNDSIRLDRTDLAVVRALGTRAACEAFVMDGLLSRDLPACADVAGLAGLEDAVGNLPRGRCIEIDLVGIPSSANWTRVRC